VFVGVEVAVGVTVFVGVTVGVKVTHPAPTQDEPTTGAQPPQPNPVS